MDIRNILSFTKILSKISELGKQNSNLRDGESRTPLLFEDIKTDASIAIDVGMEDLSLKCNLGDR